MPPLSQSRALLEPMPEIPGIQNPFQPPAPPPEQIMEDGALKTINPDGSVIIDFNSRGLVPEEQNENDHFANLAKKMGDSDLEEIASDILDGIKRDEDSRADWMTTRARGIDLLGLKLKTPQSNVGSNSSPVQGMSSIDHPVILDATVKFQATARAELLPAQGPVKVRNDTPPPPEQMPVQQTNAQDALRNSLTKTDQLASALERDMNHYLTVTATEYIPDTDRMLFYIGFGGDGFKKVYNCPLRRRPVSESVDAEDFIVSNAAVDLKNCGRITHRIRMRQSILRRMQILGAYRDIDLAPPQPEAKTDADRKKEEISGINNNMQRPEDRDFELYETYCELDLDEFAPENFKGKGLPLPYRVTIEKTSRKVLDIRRNWDEDDEQCLAKQFFVQFPFVRGLGFYGLGYIHLLGNIATTLTAAWREIIDAGMYASFPGFIYNKQLGRQLTNQFRVPPGGGIALDLGPQQKVQDAVMAIPYKDPGANFVSFVTHVESVGEKLAASTTLQVGEGKQDAPVGTTLALIEQATKVLDSAHKRLHAAQAEEFGLIKERFRDDPEAFWRFNKSPTMHWEKAQFLAALDNYNLVPVADPNNPTSLHRIAKAAVIKELQKAAPQLYDPVACDMRVMQIVGIDPQGLFRAEEAPPPPDPRFEAIKEKALASKQQAEIQFADSQLRHQTTMMQIAGRAQDRQSRERIEAMKAEIEKLKVFQAGVIHDKTAYADAVAREAELRMELIRAEAEQRRNMAKMLADIRGKREAQGSQMMLKAIEGRQKLTLKQQEHEQKLEYTRKMGEAKVEEAKAKARAAAKAKPKPKAKT